MLSDEELESYYNMLLAEEEVRGPGYDEGYRDGLTGAPNKYPDYLTDDDLDHEVRKYKFDYFDGYGQGLLDWWSKEK